MAEPNGAPPIPHPDPMTVLTRRRWAWYFVPGVLVAATISAWAYIATGEWPMLCGPVLILLIWGAVSFLTPRRGMPTPPLSAMPEFIGMLTAAGVTLAAMVAALVIDYHVTGYQFDEMIRPYQIGYTVLIFGAYMAGLRTLARRADRRWRAKAEADAADQGSSE